MILEHKGVEYKVKWITVGFSYADAVVYERVKVPVIPVCRWKKVYISNSTMKAADVRFMLKDGLTNWFNETLMDYIKYKESWA